LLEYEEDDLVGEIARIEEIDEVNGDATEWRCK
jgi:hypothetical protein